MALIKIERKQDAAQAFQHSVQADPQFTKAWKNLGVTLDDLGRHDEAVVAYRQLANINPDAK